jgi:hypothetical protein
MKRSWKIGSLAAVVLVMSSLATEASAKSWRNNMSDLSAALSDAIPFLYPDPKQDSKVLTEKIKRIYDVTKQLDGKLNHSVEIPDSDPALPYIANMLRGDFERAYQSMQDGHVDYAKSVVRASVAYCIACHTRTQMGSEFPLLKAFAEPLKRASWIEKIEFQTASRQFDSVLNDVTQKLDSPGTVGISPLDMERGSRLALSILVRFKQDPDRASLLANSITKSASASSSMKEGAEAWLKDIRTWQDEKNKKYATDKELIAAARALTDRDTSKALPIGGHTEVRYLRASLLMHDLLRTYPKSEQVPEALYIIGQSYDNLGEIGLWSLHEMYFLACIEKAPHTAQSEQCFKKYEDSITLGYSGSSGTHVPKAVRTHLDSIKKLASIKP